MSKWQVPVLSFVGAAAMFAQSATLNWAPTGRLAEARYRTCTAALSDGRVLVAGGEGAQGTLATVEIYGLDGQFKPAAGMNFARSAHTCTLLEDGRVLAAGGAAPAEIYDPVTDSWIVLETPGLHRWGQTATKLGNGLVILAGGEIDGVPTALIEIYSPVTGELTTLEAALGSPRMNHAAALLDDGSVLISGGTDGSGQALASTDVIHADGTVSAGPSMPEGRMRHSSTTLSDGSVLIAGGNNGRIDLDSALLYAGETLQQLPSMKTARSGHIALLMPGNGSVLLAGGDSNGEVTAATEVFDGTGFREVGPLTASRREIVGAALPNGTALAVGGLSENGPLAACGTMSFQTVTFGRSKYFTGDTLSVSGEHWGVLGGVMNLTVSFYNFSGAIVRVETARSTLNAVGSFSANIPVALDARTIGGKILVKAVASGLNGQDATFHAAQVSMIGTSPATVQTLENVSLTATVTPELGSLPFAGTVSFFDNGVALGGVSTFNTNSAGDRVFTMVALPRPAGSHAFTARFDPAANLASFMRTATSPATTTVVEKRTPLVSATPTPDHVQVGEDIRFNATVSRPAASLPAPTGTIEFAFNPGPGAPSYRGTMNLVPNSPSAGTSTGVPITLPAGVPGAGTYFAGYSGDDVYKPTTIPYTLHVQAGHVTLTASPTKAKLGEVVQLAVTIAPPPGSRVPVRGRVTVKNGETLVGSSEVPIDPTARPVTMSFNTVVLHSGSASLDVRYADNSSIPFYWETGATASFYIAKVVPKLNMKVHDVSPTSTEGYQVGIDGAPSMFAPTGTVSVYYAGDTKAAHTFTLTPKASGLSGFAYFDGDFIVAIPGTTFPIRFVYSGDSDYEAVEATCRARIFVGSTESSCDTGRVF